jgi:AcrR family transcriptional regulator
MTAVDIAALARDSGEAPASLRERKKLATRRALQRAALDLVADRGFAQVTVEDIAEAADVSPRTFFNYFPSKEAALFGASPDRLEQIREGILAAAPGESALAALREVLVAEARSRAEQLAELGGDTLGGTLRRIKSSHADPHLRAAHAAHLAMHERAVAQALAERLGTDLERDPYPLLLAAAATAVLRTTLAFWSGTGGQVSIDEVTALACDALAAGLPEDCALRRLAASVTPDPHPTAPDGAGKDEHR